MMAAAEMSDSVDSYCGMFTSSLCTLLDDVAPSKSKIRRGAAPGHFMLTPEAHAAKLHRRWCKRQYHLTGSEGDRLVYRVSCRRTARLIKLTRTAELAT